MAGVGRRRRRVIHDADEYNEGSSGAGREHPARSGDHQETGSAFPSSYPAADCTPTTARSANSGSVAAPA